MGLWRKVTGAAKHKATQSYSLDDSADPDGNFKQITAHIKEKYKRTVHKELGRTDHEERYQAHLRKLQAPPAQGQATGGPLCPKLRAIQPAGSLFQTTRLALVRPGTGSSYSLGTHDRSDAQFNRDESVLPLSIALKSFTEQQYAASSNAFLECAPQLQLVGGTAAQRDVIQQMTIES